jgi:cobyric acid synthase
VRDDGEIIGAGLPGGLVWGTYLHGIFDSDAFRRWFIDRLRVRRGWPALGKVCATYDLEPAFERLATVVRKSLRMDEIYRLMGLR